MKIAYIIQCHKNPAQINRLLNRIVGPECSAYVHVDKKNWGITSEISENKHINILPYEQSVNVKWGGVYTDRGHLAPYTSGAEI